MWKRSTPNKALNIWRAGRATLMLSKSGMPSATLARPADQAGGGAHQFTRFSRLSSSLVVAGDQRKIISNSNPSRKLNVRNGRSSPNGNLSSRSIPEIHHHHHHHHRPEKQSLIILPVSPVQVQKQGQSDGFVGSKTLSGRPLDMALRHMVRYPCSDDLLLQLDSFI